MVVKVALTWTVGEGVWLGMGVWVGGTVGVKEDVGGIVSITGGD